MLVVARVEFHQDGVRAGGEVAFHDFGNFVELVDRLLVHRAAFELDADVGASAETQKLRTHLIAASGDDALFDHAHDTLMDGSARHTAMCSNLLETAAGVDGDDSKDLTIQ